jgi:hypothetical protein
MNTNYSVCKRHRFRGSALDRALGASIAATAVVVPPFVFGQWGLIYALIVVIGLQIFSLCETPDPVRAEVVARRTPMHSDEEFSHG